MKQKTTQMKQKTSIVLFSSVPRFAVVDVAHDGHYRRPRYHGVLRIYLDRRTGVAHRDNLFVLVVARPSPVIHLRNAKKDTRESTYHGGTWVWNGLSWVGLAIVPYESKYTAYLHHTRTPIYVHYRYSATAVQQPCGSTETKQRQVTTSPFVCLSVGPSACLCAYLPVSLFYLTYKTTTLP